MFVCCVGSGLCYELITRSEESCHVWERRREKSSKLSSVAAWSRVGLPRHRAEKKNLSFLRLLIEPVTPVNANDAVYELRISLAACWRLASTGLLWCCYSSALSAVRIANRYGMEGRWIEFRWGQDFPHPSKPVPGPTQPPIKWAPSFFPWGKAAGAWRSKPNPIWRWG